jgi:hypothetical protein
VARRHGVNVGLLHYWRKRAKILAFEARGANGPPFVPVAISDSVEGSTPRRPSILPMIEIETEGAIVRVPTGVDSQTLTMVLAALRRWP